MALTMEHYGTWKRQKADKTATDRNTFQSFRLPLTLCLPQPDSWLVAVRELNAGSFEGGADSFDGA